MGKYKRFIDALNASWSKETAYRIDAENWTPDNPALGQCAITALLFNELYGGSIYSGVADNGVVHYWNRKNGIKRDFTKQQFKEHLKFKKVKKWDREELLSTGNVRERYSILRERVLKALNQ